MSERTLGMLMSVGGNGTSAKCKDSAHRYKSASVKHRVTSAFTVSRSAPRVAYPRGKLLIRHRPHAVVAVLVARRARFRVVRVIDLPLQHLHRSICKYRMSAFWCRARVTSERIKKKKRIVGEKT